MFRMKKMMVVTMMMVIMTVVVVVKMIEKMEAGWGAASAPAGVKVVSSFLLRGSIAEQSKNQVWI